MVASWTMAICLALAGASGATGRWLGQDGHDYVSSSPSELKPNQYQDIHIAFDGLPANRDVVKILMLGDGGDGWMYPDTPNSGKIAFVRAGRARTAHLYFEPFHVETGRTFFIRFTLDDKSEFEIHLKGRKADPNLRMPQALPAAKWVGQERQDWAGVGPAVGPDGFQDVRLAVTKLVPQFEVRSIDLEASGGSRWQSGANPKGYSNAELVRDPKDPSKADFWFQPDRDLGGLKLKMTIAYTQGKVDVIPLSGSRCDPKLRMPQLAAPKLIRNTITARWVGQDGGPGAKPGDVHVALAGLPADRVPVAAVLSDSEFGNWVFRGSDRVKVETDPTEFPLVFRRGPDRTRADLVFAPTRDESGATLTLRLVFQDGESTVAQFAGGPCDLLKIVPPIAPTSIAAKPGDDLGSLAKQYGTVRLSAGTYRLSKPLVLEKPVTLVGERGATLLFSQAQGDPAWSSAIKIHGGPTTLQGFAVRFSGPVRWRPDVAFGAAVIGVSDNLDPPQPDPKYGITIAQLDLETPPVEDPGAWVEAPRLIRLVNARSGRVANNVLKGGIIECYGGPWQVVDNDHRGTVPGTYTHGVLAVHDARDLLVRGNRVRSVAPAGKTWRFMVVTGYGRHVRIADNVVEKVGPRDDDTLPSNNAPEIILTESYHLDFEGRLSALSADGRIVRIGQPQGPAPHNGDVVSVLAGPHAGQWRQIAQVLGPTTYLMATPLPKGSEVISISNGFTDTVIEGNSIDSRGSRVASNLVLAGNHYGTAVRSNRLLGGGESLRIQACGSETPRFWSWSHMPYQGGILEGNLLEDAFGGIIGVEHNAGIKTNAGRTYMSLILKDNTVRWTESFLKGLAQAGTKAASPALKVGYPSSLDPGELVVTEKGTRLEAPAGTPPSEALKVEAALLNGRRTVNHPIVLTPEPTPRLSRAAGP